MRRKILKRIYCIPLELKVNKIGNSKDWVSIGDHLYYFINPNKFLSDEKPSEVLLVKTNYYLELKKIILENKYI